MNIGNKETTLYIERFGDYNQEFKNSLLSYKAKD
jgi:hypothetical protein